MCVRERTIERGIEGGKEGREREGERGKGKREKEKEKGKDSM